MATVVITRPDTAIAAATAVYKKAGFDVFTAPCFAIQTNPTVQPQWLKTEAEVWLVLSVYALKHALLIAPDLKPNKNTRVIAVGPAVEQLWRQCFAHPVESHPGMNSEGVIELLQKYRPRSVKIMTADGGRRMIQAHCMQQQISYTQINTYQRIALDVDVKGITDLLVDQSAMPVVLTVTSGGILQQFKRQMSAELKAQLSQLQVLVAAPRLATMAMKLGFENVHTADDPSDLTMCAAVKQLTQVK